MEGDYALFGSVDSGKYMTRLPLYVACGKNVTQAGMFFGLIVFKLLMERQDKTWGFGRYEKDGRQIASMTYFELKNPPMKGKTP